jgi:hypothetical protein
VRLTPKRRRDITTDSCVSRHSNLCRRWIFDTKPVLQRCPVRQFAGVVVAVGLLAIAYEAFFLENEKPLIVRHVFFGSTNLSGFSQSSQPVDNSSTCRQFTQRLDICLLTLGTYLASVRNPATRSPSTEFCFHKFSTFCLTHRSARHMLSALSSFSRSRESRLSPEDVVKKSILLMATLLIASLALGQSIFQETQTRPIKLGTSGGNVNDATRSFCCSGTLGSLVTKGGVQYILSNNHVLARTNSATIGEDISQPGLVDSGCSVPAADTVADLSEFIQLGTNNVDAAIAATRTGDVTTTGEILAVGVPASSTASATVGRGVAKAGRTTGLTCASIGSVNTNVNVQYQARCGSGKKFTIAYTNQVLINSSSFSAGGDSGSLIVTSDTAQPVALLFAGSSTTTIGNPIGDVANALGVTFVGGATHSVTCPASPAAATQAHGLSASEFNRASTAKEGHWQELFQDAAIQGVGVGEDPGNPGQGAVIIYVEEGRAHGPIPAEIAGVKTVVVVTDRFRATGWNEKNEGGSCSAK